MAKVIVTIDRQGKTTVEAEGWQGPTCATITRPYAKALGKDAEETIKPEFYETAATTQTQETQ